MLKIVHMKVNGKEVELAVDERESLLDTLLCALNIFGKNSQHFWQNILGK